MSGNIAIAIVVAVVLASVGLLLNGSQRLDIGGPLRDRMLRRAARRLATSTDPPATVERSYWNAGEYQRDCARLESVGYVVDYESDTDSYVSFDLPGRYGRRQSRRRVPMYHVTYRSTRGDARSAQ